MADYERVVQRSQQVHFEQAIADMDRSQAGAVALVSAEPVGRCYVRLHIRYRHPLDLFVLGFKVASWEGGRHGS